MKMAGFNPRGRHFLPACFTGGHICIRRIGKYGLNPDLAIQRGLVRCPLVGLLLAGRVDRAARLPLAVEFRGSAAD